MAGGFHPGEVHFYPIYTRDLYRSLSSHNFGMQMNLTGGSQAPRIAALWIFLTVLFASSVCPASEKVVIGPEMQPHLASFAEKLGDLPCGAILDNTKIRKDNVELRFRMAEGDTATAILLRSNTSGAAVWRGKKIALLAEELAGRCPELLLQLEAPLAQLDELWQWKIITGKAAETVVERQAPVDSGSPLLPQIPLSLPAALLWLLWGVLVAAIAVSAWRRAAWKQRLAVLCLFLFAVAVRIILVEPTMTTIHSDSFAPGKPLEARFGPGGQALEALTYLVFGPSSGTIFGLYIIVGSLLIPFTYVFLRRLDHEGSTGVIAALFLAILPLHVILSASDAEHVLVASLFGSAVLGWRRLEGRLPGFASSALTLVSIALLIMVRFDAFLLPLALVIWVFIDGYEYYKGRLRWVLFFIVWAGATALCHQYYGSIMTGNLGPWHPDYLIHMLFFIPLFDHGYADNPMWMPTIFIALYYIGIFSLIRRDWRRLILLAMLVAFILAPAIAGYFGNNPMRSRYYLQVSPFQMLLAAYGFNTLAKGIRRIIGNRLKPATQTAFLLMLALLLVPIMEWSFFKGHQAFEKEFIFLSRNLKHLPEGCHVIIPRNRYPYCEDTLVVRQSLVNVDRPDLVWVDDWLDRPEHEIPDCLAYYKRATCTYSAEACGGRGHGEADFASPLAEIKKECEELEKRLELKPLKNWNVEVMTQFSDPPTANIDIGLYRVTGFGDGIGVKEEANNGTLKVSGEDWAIGKAKMGKKLRRASDKHEVFFYAPIFPAALFLLLAGLTAFLHHRGRKDWTNPVLAGASLALVWTIIEIFTVFLADTSSDANYGDVDRTMRPIFYRLGDSCYPTNHSGYFIPYQNADYPDVTSYCSLAFEKSWDICNSPTASTHPDRLRILALGDSFTEAIGVHYEDTWPVRLEGLLAGQSESGKDPLVINCGMAAYNVSEISKRFRSRNERHKPQVVIYAYVLNDVFPNHELEALEAQMPKLDRKLGYDAWMRENPILSNLVENSPTARLFLRRYLAGEVSDAMHYMYNNTYTDPPGGELASTLDIISGMKADCEGNGTRFLVAIWPVLHRLDSYPFSKIHQLLIRELSNREITAIDLLPVFEGHNEKEFHVHINDSHPNKRAQAMAARAIADQLVDLNWVGDNIGASSPDK